MLKIGKTCAAVALIATTLQPMMATSASARGWGDFISCWAARDFEGNDVTFTAGCWERHMGSSKTMSPKVAGSLKAMASKYQQEKRALNRKYSGQLSRMNAGR